MKKVISTLSLAAFVATQVHAQKTSFGPEIGLTYNTISQRINGENRSTGYQFGFTTGAVADFQFNDHFSVSPGLLLSLNNGGTSYGDGSSYTGSNIPTSFTDDRTYRFHYIDVPVFFIYKTQNSYNDPHVFFGIGPAAHIAIAGRYEQTYTEVIHGRASTQRYNYSMPYGNNERFDRARGFDLSANAIIGFQTSRGYYFKAQYGIGLLNLAPNADGNNALRNSGVSLSVGLRLLTIKRYAWS